MNEPTSQKTPEQIAQIKRLAPPIAVAALTMALAGMTLLLTTHVDDRRPPSIVGVNLCFCAMLMGIGILLWTRGSGVVPWVSRFCLPAVLIGAVGPFIFFRQGVDLRMAMEQREMGNVTAIVHAAQSYARDNGGSFPPSLNVLVDQHRLRPADLHSPYSSTDTIDHLRDLAAKKISQADYDAWFDHHSDYDYCGADLHLPAAATATSVPATLPGTILVAYGKDPIMRIRLAVAFDDGTARFITLEEAEGVMKASNDARVRSGLPALRPPDAVQRARTQERAANPERQP